MRKLSLCRTGKTSTGPMEMQIAAAFALATVLVGWALGLPFSFPSSGSAAFVGVHYLYPLIAIGVWAVFVSFQSNRATLTCLWALPAYAIVLVCHFNLKLWIPHVNPALWDGVFYQTDVAVRPIVELATQVRVAISPIIPLDSNFYMFGFIATFYLSLMYFCFAKLEHFRTLVVAVLLLQVFGTLGYLLTPALGPFLYEQGVEPNASNAQAGMYAAWQDNSAGGARWLAVEGGRQLTVGLAAMPSLHTGGTFLFVLFAHRYARVLHMVLLPIFAFIAVDAIANRWHYVVDLPVGMALAVAAMALAHALVGPRSVDSGGGHEAGEPTPALAPRWSMLGWEGWLARRITAIAAVRRPI